MKTILFLLFALPLMALELPVEKEVDRLRMSIGENSGNGEPTLLAACAFGYAACGNAARAEECASEIRKRFSSSQALKLLEPGAVTMPCQHCYGIPVRCAKCNGEGKRVMMVGSAPVKCLSCNGTGIVKTNCKACKDTNRDPMSKVACSRLFRRIGDDRNLGIFLESEIYIKYLVTSINMAKSRMRVAVRIAGLVGRQGSGGVIVLPTEMLWKDGVIESDSLVFIEMTKQVSDGTSVSLVAFKNGIHEYVDSYGNVHAIDRYITSPWIGCLEQLSKKSLDTVRGIQRSVYDKIKAKAEKKWPDDYRMQKHVIDEEIEAYKHLHE